MQRFVLRGTPFTKHVEAHPILHLFYFPGPNQWGKTLNGVGLRPHLLRINCVSAGSVSLSVNVIMYDHFAHVVHHYVQF